MNPIVFLWSALSGACLMLASLHLLVWLRNRRAWENLLFAITVIGVVGLAAGELATMQAVTPEEYAAAIRWSHLNFGLCVASCLGFVHFHFGTGSKRLLALALGLRALAVLANFTTGESLHIQEIHSLRQDTFLGQTVTMLGEWTPNRWVILGQLAALAQITYLGHASRQLWKTGTRRAKRRALLIGGGLTLFFLASSVQAGLVAAGVLRMPFLISFTFLGVVVVMGYELSRDVLRAAELLRDLQRSEQQLTLAADYRVDLPDGSLRWISARGTVERDAQGKALRMRGISMDITGSKEAELESARHRQELAHLSRVSILGELAGTLAHELNQPLAAILGNAQVGRRMIDQEVPDLKEVSAILDDVADDAKRAGGIIHGMRAMFRKDPVSGAQAVDLNESVDQVLVLLHSEIIGRKAKIELRLGGALPPAAAGRVEVQQVILNLVISGMDAMKGEAKEVLVEIATWQEDDRLHLAVRDHGPGIPGAMAPRLFEPFLTTKSGGLGLGLAISRGIAERFRGELTAENHPEGGALFRLTLPAAAE